jgi:hypothetical protein
MLCRHWFVVAARSLKNFSRSRGGISEDPTGLLFLKAQDAAAIGQPNRAVTMMMQLIQRYPNNPGVKDWIAGIRSILTPSSPVEATAASVPSSNGAMPPSTPTPTPKTN